MIRTISQARTFRRPLALLISALLSACGGGGGGGGPATDASAAVPAAAQINTGDNTASAVIARPSLGADTSQVLVASTDNSIASATDSGLVATTGVLQTAQGSAVTVANTTSTLVVNARATLLNNVGATIEVRVNGQLVQTAEVRSAAFANMTFTVPSLAAGGSLDIVYTNDAAAGGVDRNLWIRSITVDGVTTAVIGSTARYDVGDGALAFDGKNVLAAQEGMFWNGALRFAVASAAAAVAPNISAGGYYIDQLNGSDTYNGSITQPWKTLRKATEARLAAGQGIYLRCGQVWRESLALGTTQLVDGSKIAGYGAECGTSKATISGADDFSGGWTKSGNLWSRAVPQGTPKISRVFVNGTPLVTARWPNLGTGGSQGYALVDAAAASSSTVVKPNAADLARLKGPDLSNAVVYLRTSAWVIEQRTVTGLAGNTGLLTLDKATDFPIDAGEGYVLEDKLWMLDAPGEFFHDTATGKLYIYPPDSATQANLNAFSVEGSVRDTPLALSGLGNLVVSNLAVRMGRGIGLELRDAPGAAVDSVDASYNGTTGIRLVQDATKAGASVTRSTANSNMAYGIDAQFAGKATITGNTVTGTGMLGSPGWSFAAIAGGDGGKVVNNIVSGAAYHGIRFSGTGGSQVIGNTVSGHCQRLADCGGIYTWNGPKATGSAQNSLVENNQVLPATPNAEGAVGPGTGIVIGVFLDDFSYGVTVRGNVIHGVPVGISVHNGRNNTIDSNRIWLSTLTAISAGMDQNDQDYLTGNVFRNNQIVPVKSAVNNFPALPTFSESYPIWFFHNLAGSAAITSGSNVFTGNQVVRLDGSMDGVHAWIRSNTEDRKLSSAQWAAFNPLDVATATPMKFALYSLVLGPELVQGGTFDTGLGTWGSWFNPTGTGATVRSGSGTAGCTGNCVTLTAATPQDYISSPGFTMTPNAPHLYAYTATLGAAATLGWPYISRWVTPWDSMASTGFSSSVSLSGAAGQVVRYEAFFTPKAADLSRVVLQVKTAGVPVTFDNVSVREITGFSFSKTSDWGAVATAPVNAATTVTCASLGWGSTCTAAGLDGKAIALPQTLNAGSAQLFLRTDSSWRR